MTGWADHVELTGPVVADGLTHALAGLAAVDAVSPDPSTRMVRVTVSGSARPLRVVARRVVDEMRVGWPWDDIGLVVTDGRRWVATGPDQMTGGPWTPTVGIG